VLILIYAFSTPGEYITLWRLQWRPTYEGLRLGLTQVLNIVTMLAGLSLLLTTTSRARLIGGLYQLLMPLNSLHLNAERFAVRIWLSLHYVESDNTPALKQFKGLNLDQVLEASHSHQQPAQELVAIELHPFKMYDFLCISMVMLAVVCVMV
jgi:energy-coupling factor transport system permease protein